MIRIEYRWNTKNQVYYKMKSGKIYKEPNYSYYWREKLILRVIVYRLLVTKMASFPIYPHLSHTAMLKFFAVIIQFSNDPESSLALYVVLNGFIFMRDKTHTSITCTGSKIHQPLEKSILKLLLSLKFAIKWPFCSMAAWSWWKFVPRKIKHRW